MSGHDHEIALKTHATGGRYSISANGAEAELTYSRAGEHLIIIDHTGVPDEMRGLGLGPVLVRRAVDDARDQGIKVLPLCPFAAAEFRKHAEYHDVLSR